MSGSAASVAEAKPESGASAYADLLKEQLEAQGARKSSFEQRGLAVITTSGALVTLLFALAALSTKQAQTFELPEGARGWLLLALGLFFAAGVAALITNLPLNYQAIKPDEVNQRLKQKPVRDAEAAVLDIALTRVKVLKDAKRKNSVKGVLLVVAMGLEVLAVGCVALAVRLIL